MDIKFKTRLDLIFKLFKNVSEKFCAMREHVFWYIVCNDNFLPTSQVGPFVMPPRLNSEFYNNFLRHELPQILQEAGVPENVRQSMYYMHDGAPCHSSCDITKYLNEEFGDRWLGRTGPWQWPPRSSDFTPMDFFL